MKWRWRTIGIALAGCGVEWFIYNMVHIKDHSALVAVNLVVWPMLAFLGLGGYCFINLGDD